MSNITLCPFEITDTHICYPTTNSTWYEGTNNMVKWFIFDPIYRNNYSSLSLYFYYKNNYQYYQTVKFTNIAIDRGFYPFFIDKNFFPINCTENELKWDYSLLLLGNKINPNIVLNSSFSDWIPTNFILIQNASQSCFENINNTMTNSSDIQNNNNFGYMKKIETWKIIVIVICCILLLIILAILIRLLYIKKIIFRKNKNHSEINNIILKEIVYQKPEMKKSIKKSKYNKPNEHINYEKPNSY